MKGIRILLGLIVVACGHPEKEAGKQVAQQSDKQIADSLYYSNPVSALTYYGKFVKSSIESLNKADAYMRMADIQHNLGDYWNCEETAIKSLKLLDEKNKAHLPYIIAVYNLLGNNALDLENYDAAQSNYDRAIQLATDEITIGIYTNNKGVAYQKQREYEKAIASFETALSKVKAGSIDYARALSNLAKTRWLKDPAYNATGELHTSLAIRNQENNLWGLNASYAHLSDYYSSSRSDSALFYAQKMYEVARQLNSPDDKAEALEKLIQLSPVNLKGYFITYKHIRDSLQDARTKAKNQYIQAQYDSQKSKDENLKLQQKNTRQRIILYGSGLAFVVVLAAIVSSYRKRRKRIQFESANAIRENQLKTSKKVHDVVANGLYRIMTDIEHEDKIEKEKLLDKIEVLYEQSRDLSYEQPQDNSGDFAGDLNAMLNSFATSDTRVLTVGNNNSLWTGIQTQVRKELEYVLQELMVNMAKHSHARNVVISFERQAENFRIQYKDDGEGFAPGYQPGNGIRNTGNRIQGIGGRIIFDSSPGKGLTVEILIPISKTV